jgi:HlyD family secretion protein
MQKKRLLRTLPLLLVPATIASVVAYKSFAPVPVIAVPVARGVAVDAVYATATVEPTVSVNLKAKLGGTVRLLVREGKRVEKGELLARVESPTLEYDLARARADLSAASQQAAPTSPQVAALRAARGGISTDLAQAKADLERSRALLASGSVARAETERYEARVKAIESQLEANLAQERSITIDLSANAQRQAANVSSVSSRIADAEVRAPVDGVVLVRRVDDGEVVAVNQPLLRLGDTKVLELEAFVDEADVARVHDGAAGSKCAVTMLAFPGKVFGAKVLEIFPDANREKKAFVVKARFDAPPDGLRSGMSAELNIVTGEKPNVLLAPADAIEAGKVWVVTDGRAHRAEVGVGIHDLLRAEITGGLGEGDLVVVSGADKLSEGRRVSVTRKEQDRLAATPGTGQVAQTGLR